MNMCVFYCFGFKFLKSVFFFSFPFISDHDNRIQIKACKIVNEKIWLGHLNTIFAQRHGNFNKPIFKISNAREAAQEVVGDFEASSVAD